MNWDAAIDRQHAALLRLLTVMFAAVGFEAGGSVEVVPLRIRLMVLRLLRPAESALRRLVFLRARKLPDAEYVPGPVRDKTAKRSKNRSKSLAFPLFDPQKKTRRTGRKHPKGIGPRIFYFDGYDTPPEPEKPAILPDDPVSAARLCQRLNALAKALGDLDAQAHRLKRIEARRKLSIRFCGERVVRAGPPPGHREKGRSNAETTVDKILRDCQDLALWWTAEQDTS